MKLSVSAYRAHASAHKKILTSSYQQHYGSTSVPPICNPRPQFTMEDCGPSTSGHQGGLRRPSDLDDGDCSADNTSSRVLSAATSKDEDDDSSNNASSESKSPGQRLLSKLSPFVRGEDMQEIIPSSPPKSFRDEKTDSDNEKRGHKWRHVQAVMAYYQALRKIKRTKSNQRWMKLRTTVQISSAMQKKPPLKREDSFLKRFSTRQIPETQETVEDTGSEGATGEHHARSRRRKRVVRVPRTVVNPDENFYFYWLWVITACVLYNLWTLIVRQSFPELQMLCHYFWVVCDGISDTCFALDVVVQLRTGYLEQGLMVYDSKKLARHYITSRAFLLDLFSLTPLDLLQFKIGINPIVRFPRFFKVYRAVSCYYIVESRTVYPNFWRVINLIHILLILAHWFGCFYFLLSEHEGFQGDWVYPYRPGDYATLTRKYLGSLYWSTLTLTTIGDLPTPETNAEYVFTIVSYLIGVFIFATIVGQVGNVITNRNANRLEFERLLDGAKTYMRHHKVPGGMKRRVLRWYDYSWSRGRIQGGGDINTALGLLPDKLKTELALHVNLSVLKKVTIFQECQPEFLHDLVLKMKAYIFTPGDSICRRGEVAREMFIIADGILEVISETGRVLTTMKAGDFFGEIGILNLDGLNKRTADVRSVGYSELFSLSREDVLAAMKDYPEAQEILQSLGRKRLQEARNCSRQKPGKGETDQDKLGDDSAPKRIVHKLRSDVKGIRNAIRNRSRAGRRSMGESVDIHPASEGKILRRMPRVESDEYSQANDDTADGKKDGERTISPIGAGLPLLTRLKMLKERQDREEKTAKQRLSTSSIISPTAQTTPSSSKEEPEVIGAGLPLLQRLLLLKAKEDKEKNRLTLTNSNQPSSSDTISPISIKSPLSPTIKILSPIRKGSESSSPGKTQSPTTKRSRKNSSGSSDSTSRPKVSFKDKILQVQSDGTSVCQPLQKDMAEKPAAVVEPTPKTESSNLISIPHTVVSKIKSPAKCVGTTFRDRLKQLHSGAQTSDTSADKSKYTSSSDKFSIEVPPLNTNEAVKEETIPKKPWAKLKMASILGESKSQNKSTSEDIKSIETLQQDNSNTADGPNSETNSGINRVENNNIKLANNNMATQNEKPQICLTSPLSSSKDKLTDFIPISISTRIPANINQPSSASTSSSLTPRTSKHYSSIDDLSPEYGGLPFVKKLKILNERQKLEELENVIKTRSSSLDCTSSSEDLLTDTLTRSHSEGSAMYKRRLRKKSADSVGSHESNETLERRTLKSILKKLSEDIGPSETMPRNPKDFKKLIRAPTIEGYAARHSKFSKSVTFHRHTLPSPPTSVLSEANDSVFLSPEPEKNSETQIVIPTVPPCIRTTELLQQPEDILTSTIRNLDQECNLDVQCEKHQTIDNMYEIQARELASLRPEEIKVPTKKPKITLISAVANQRKLLRGSLEEQEYFGEVLFGIKQVIQGHLHEVQTKFQERFSNLENEVRKRDEIISQLQNRIQELERFGMTNLSLEMLQTSINSDLDLQLPQERRHSDTMIKNSSGSEDFSGDQGFMRGDSLDTVFATSPPATTLNDDQSPGDISTAISSTFPENINPEDITEENIANCINLEKLSYAELKSLADSLAQQKCRSKEVKDSPQRRKLALKLDSKSGTYSRRKAAKLQQRKSWEDHSEQESMELHELTSRPLSPQGSGEDRSLLSPEQSSLRSSKKGRHSFHFFGSHLDSTKSKIKKTLSVDAGMHQKGKRGSRLRSDRTHRKFSLGSLFGYHRGVHHHKSEHANGNDVIIDIGSDYSWSDSTMTSTSSDSDSIPRTPVFEEFVESTSSRRSKAGGSGSTLSSSVRGSGGDWEVMMLAEELEKREREDARRHHYPTTLRDLAEESETPPTPLREDSLEEAGYYEELEERFVRLSQARQNRTRQTSGLLASMEESKPESDDKPPASSEIPKSESSKPDQAGPSRDLSQGGLILRAASLDQESTNQARFGSLKTSSSADNQKQL